MTARLQDVIESDDVALDIDIRVLDAVANASLSGQVDDDVELVFGKKTVNQFTVSNAALYEVIIDS